LGLSDSFNLPPVRCRSSHPTCTSGCPTECSPLSTIFRTSWNVGMPTNLRAQRDLCQCLRLFLAFGCVVAVSHPDLHRALHFSYFDTQAFQASGKHKYGKLARSEHGLLMDSWIS